MSPEATDFLYPFIEADERDAVALLSDLEASAAAKGRESARLRMATVAACGPELDVVAAAIAERAVAGGVVFTFGNGGSATDAQQVAGLFTRPPSGVAVAARSLVDDPSVLTALSNDVGFELVFARQLIAHARAGDTALGISTSGDSDNLLVAFAEAKRRGLLTVALGGRRRGSVCRQRRHRPLPGRAVGQRPSHPGDPGGAGP